MNEIFEIAKAQTDTYKAAYDQGWNDALAHAMRLINKPKHRPEDGFLSPEESALKREEARLEKARR
jgi:hypothetical protein